VGIRLLLIYHEAGTRTPALLQTINHHNEKEIANMENENVVDENNPDMEYYEQHGIGRAKYTVSFWDGLHRHADGSKFFDLRIFKSKRSLKMFINQLKRGASKNVR
jgi:hypothetical protein